MERELSAQPIKVFGFIAVALFLAAFFTCSLVATQLSLLQASALAINFSSFVVCGYDKMIAGSDVVRVPEKIFLSLAALGGSVGLLFGMNLFRHKTCKASFLVKLVAILGLQLVALRMINII